MSLDDFERANGKEGHQYELVDGKVEVYETPECPHDSIYTWLLFQLLDYAKAHREIVGYLSGKAAVYPLDRLRPSYLAPDITLFGTMPDMPRSQLRWRDLIPFLVVEVTSPDCPEKDLIRNVPLYLDVPSIREYWIVDQRPDPDYPSLLVYRRRGKKWQKPIAVEPGQTYTTRLLPGFELKLDAPPE